MKPNVIVALLVGLVLGFAMGKVVGGPQRGDEPAAAAVPTGGTNYADESRLAVKSSDMPAGTFTGLTDAQKFQVMRVLNDNDCDCGCGRGSVATCIKTDPNCPKSPALMKRAVEMVKEGKSAADIQLALFGTVPKGGVVKPRQPTQAADDSNTVYKVPLDGAPVQGNPDALVTIVEFSDYQCPFCSRANGTVNELTRSYGSKIRLAMRQNPLPFHPNALPSAKAALAAGEQGKYWEMHELLFTHQQELDETHVEGFAKQLKLDIPKWKAAMASQKVQDIISKDQATAQALGAHGTPAFFINGRKISGAQPIENFKKVIDEEYAKAQELVKSGVKPTQVYARVMEKGVTAPPAAAAPSAPSAQAQAPGGAKKVEVPADSPFKGPKHAKVTIVEFSDFQCPFCSRAVPVLKQIAEAYPKDVKIVFRNLPLPMHNNAQLAAEAAMAAHAQGKFWEMHDKLFTNQRALERPNLEQYAKEIGLDVGKFKDALDNHTYRERVAKDASAATAVGVNGTPTFYFNGHEQVGVPAFEQIKTLIDAEIARANKLIASGTKLENLYDKMNEEAASAAPPEQGPAQIEVGNAPVKGPKHAPVTIVAYSDFQCPFCGRVVPTLHQIEQEYQGKVKLVFKNQPLPFHPNARPAAMAALAAHEQGKFWEMHDKLFANQQTLDRAHYEQYAQELGLDMPRFKAALDSNKFEAQIASDSSEGTRLGAQGTPTFFINGRQFVGAQPIEAFKQVIDDELKKAGKK